MSKPIPSQVHGSFEGCQHCRSISSLCCHRHTYVAGETDRTLALRLQLPPCMSQCPKSQRNREEPLVPALLRSPLHANRANKVVACIQIGILSPLGLFCLLCYSARGHCSTWDMWVCKCVWDVCRGQWAMDGVVQSWVSRVVSLTPSAAEAMGS